jgi:tetratricopeptide (TPR) repeat protein
MYDSKWKCPDCSKVNDKSALRSIYEKNIANGTSVFGNENCSSCRKSFKMEEIYGGVYDADKPSVTPDSSVEPKIEDSPFSDANKPSDYSTSSISPGISPGINESTDNEYSYSTPSMDEYSYSSPSLDSDVGETPDYSMPSLEDNSKSEFVYSTETPEDINKEFSLKGAVDEVKQSSDDIFKKLNLSNDPVENMFLAAKLMTMGEFGLCIEAYKLIRKKHPEKYGECEKEIGDAFSKLGKYDFAVKSYKSAMHNGVEPALVVAGLKLALEKGYEEKSKPKQDDRGNAFPLKSKPQIQRDYKPKATPNYNDKPDDGSSFMMVGVVILVLAGIFGAYFMYAKKPNKHKCVRFYDKLRKCKVELPNKFKLKDSFVQFCTNNYKDANRDMKKCLRYSSDCKRFKECLKY